MSPLQPGDPADGHGEDGDHGGDDAVEYRPPLPPEDRIWRHPSEVGAMRAATAAPPRDGGNGRLVAVGLVAALIGATLSIGVVAVAGGFDPETRLVERQVAVQPVTDVGSEADNVAAVTTRTSPAIVGLTIGRDGTTGTGTAIAYRSDGHLLTTGHLVEGADTIDARLHDGTVIDATLVGIDEVTDVAVLRVEGVEVEPAALGTVRALEVGDRAIAIATDDGAWSPMVATGVVSALGRRLQVGDGRVLHDMIVVDVPLTDAAGGGALVDTHGAVIGLTSGFPTATDLGMATPIDLVSRVADDLIEHGRARHVWLGVEGTDVELAAAKQLEIAGGAVVKRVIESGPAATAGLQPGDVVVALDGEQVSSMSDLISALRLRHPGDVVVLSVHRGGELVMIQLTLAERSA